MSRSFRRYRSRVPGPGMIKKAPEKVGAKGINLAGMCCSANEVLMRHGVPVAGNYLQQELAHRHRRGGR